MRSSGVCQLPGQDPVLRKCWRRTDLRHEAAKGPEDACRDYCCRERGKHQALLVQGKLVVAAVEGEVQHDTSVAGGNGVEEEAVDAVLKQLPQQQPAC